MTGITKQQLINSVKEEHVIGSEVQNGKVCYILGGNSSLFKDEYFVITKVVEADKYP
ncbi:hypothetical protein LCGC14_2447550 [marine sediment metagenome]|uniref:Uncharacterized protein n=1 Tax=marine sediment metagenome TaxID=412755 RepID=A0A0F9DU91_9ZZZZ